MRSCILNRGLPIPGPGSLWRLSIKWTDPEPPPELVRVRQALLADGLFTQPFVMVECEGVDDPSDTRAMDLGMFLTCFTEEPEP